MRRFYVFFFLSGFCSILYELVWLRLSMSTFGVTTPLVSIVLSVFMAGLGLGSWFSGYLIRSYVRTKQLSALQVYGITEFFIGISAFLVPIGLSARGSVFQMFASSSASSLRYYFLSGIWIAGSLLPWCVCMGATIPLGMKAVEEHPGGDSSKSFSYLYVANLAGAIAGTLLPLLVIETVGFTRTLRIGALVNFTIAILAVSLAKSKPDERKYAAACENPPLNPATQLKPPPWILFLLFMTGFSSMAMELIWVRQFTPYLGTFVYAFAIILASYLVWAFIGGRRYRRQPHLARRDSPTIYFLLASASVLPAFAAEPSFEIPRVLALIFSIGPVTAIVGFLTPMLVDVWSGGNPERAGRAYAVNIVGCILGPLVANFLLFPYLQETRALMIFAVSWAAVAGVVWIFNLRTAGSLGTGLLRPRNALAVAVVAILLAGRLRGIDGRFHTEVVRRDHTASVIAAGAGMEKRLYINGIAITQLTPTTKMMAHLPLAFLDHSPRRVLDICLGMGTTYRSALSWGVPTTAVELVPKVPEVMWYFHPDAEQLFRSPLSTLVIDDGRRFMERSAQQYDVITIDPPPPVEAAGSSMLYSEEFYAVAKRRLRPGGILQQWIPNADHATRSAVAKALKNSFPYVRAFKSVEGWGIHFLASTSQIPLRSPAELANRLPQPAALDLLEWGPYATTEAQFSAVLSSETSIDALIEEDPGVPALSDDRPVNEYYLLRRLEVLGSHAAR